jgi:hypothetical protein
MTHPFISVNRRADFGLNQAAVRNRVILVAVNSEMMPPIFHQETVLQRMRVVSMAPDQADDLEPANLLPGVFKRPLPPMPRPQAPAAQSARLVRGEILHDNQGRMYEKTGNNIRPLHRLVSGPQGQVLELFPSATPRRGSQAAVLDSDTDMPAGDQLAGNSHQEAEVPDVTDSPPLSSPLSRGRDESGHSSLAQANENPLRAPYRKFFPDPGQRRIVRLGDFKALLAPQLAHPERLRDSHWIPCYLQVYESCAPQRLDSLAAAALGDAKLATQLHFFSDGLARRLGLPPSPKLRIPPGTRQPGDILPYERFFRFQVERDPTAENSVAGDHNQRGDAAAHSTAIPSTRASTPAGAGLKRSIPERMIKPWEFRVTRDEALYDMNVAKPFAGWLSSLSRWLKGVVGSRGEMKKWRVLLSGKSADEQLWGIRPPSGGVSQPAIREWARKTLEAAGYDSQAMLLEWEIFWRRKGV